MFRTLTYVGLTIASISMGLSYANSQSTRKVITLSEARERISSKKADEIGGISLRAFDYAHEVEVGEGIRIIAVSTNDGGGLLAFRPDGNPIQILKTGRILTLQLFDLDENGISEIVTDEISGRGTGVLQKEFNVYRVSLKELRRIWEEESYYLDANQDHDAKSGVAERFGFLRFDSSGFGRSPRMEYLLMNSDNKILKHKRYEMRVGAAVTTVPRAQ